jgi:hypothetical protein
MLKDFRFCTATHLDSLYIFLYIHISMYYIFLRNNFFHSFLFIYINLIKVTIVRINFISRLLIGNILIAVNISL